MIASLWSTPVGVFELGNDAFNSEIVAALNANPTSSKNMNVWDNPAPSIAELSRLMLSAAQEVMKHRALEVPIKHVRGWASMTRPGEAKSAHAHPQNILVGVYFVLAPEQSGDLVLIDPASGTMWSDGIDGQYSCRPYHRIKPKPGTAVFFPGHVTHFVDPNRSADNRLSIAANFRIPG